MTLSICTAQLNFVVGDLPGNVQKIVAAAHEAHAAGAQLLLTPELALCGYAAEDLFLRPAFQAACDDAVKAVARETAGLKDLAIVLGHPQRTAPDAPAFSPCLNAASVLRNGRVEQTYAKRELPNYQVFDERRYFVPGQVPCVFEAGGMRVGLLICEDAWHAAPARDCAQFGAELLVVINASLFISAKALNANRPCGTGCWRPDCRWSMPIWWVARTRWFLRAVRLRWTLQESWQDVRRVLKKNWFLRRWIKRNQLSK